MSRTRIPAWEWMSGLAVLLALVAFGGWILAQRNNFNPADRDLDPTVDFTAPSVVLGSEAGGASTGTAPDLGPFPPALLDGGWVVDGRVESFGPDTLYEKIDGGAERFLATGFRRLDFVRIEFEKRTSVSVELYDQGSAANAERVFSEMVDDTLPVTVDGAVTYQTNPVGACGRIGRYYFAITADSDDQPAPAKAQALVAVMAGLHDSGAEQ